MRSSQDVEKAAEMFRAGISQSEIAQTLGVSRWTVRNWCSGRTRALAAAGLACPRCGQDCLPVPRDRHPAYSYLLGQYLGDGGIFRHPRSVFRLVIFGDSRYTGIADEAALAMATVAPRSRVNRQLRSGGSCVAVYSYSRAWPCLFPQHGEGPKHRRQINLDDWQLDITHRHPRELIRGLIHSDGCRSLNTVRIKGKTYRYPRYSFSNRSDDIRGIFCEHLDLLGVPWRRMNRWNISVARREGVAMLDEFVGPKR